MSAPATSSHPERAIELLLGRHFVALTGAGISTDSGIPDYRGPRPAGSPPVRMPMTYQDFVSSAESQQRYWARAHVGWSRMGTAKPNAGHHALARLAPDLVITQNVDGLHESAGQRELVALHGRISDVVCLDCRQITGRETVQATMSVTNPGYLETHSAAVTRPDGDAVLTETTGFVVPACELCGGRLKPDVVFFGENVPRDRVLACQQAVERAEALLVVGSSLTVMSGLRFVRQAHRLGIPVVIVNRGHTRGDDLATVRVDLGCSEFLAALGSRTASSSATPRRSGGEDAGPDRGLEASQLLGDVLG